MRILIVITLFALSLPGMAQSKTTRAFSEKYDNAFTLFFYNNTLKMLNQENNAEFEALIKDIDKMKFIRVSKKEHDFSDEDFKQIIADYHEENFEDLMTMRHEGMNINVFIQEDDGVTTGLVLLMNDSETFSILDIKGKVPLNQLATLISKVQDMN